MIYYIIGFYLGSFIFAIINYHKFGGMMRLNQLQECILFCVFPFIMIPTYIIHNIRYKKISRRKKDE